MKKPTTTFAPPSALLNRMAFPLRIAQTPVFF